MYVCELLGFIKLNTTAYHPQCDGAVEFLNCTYLKPCSASKQVQWAFLGLSQQPTPQQEKSVPTCCLAWTVVVQQEQPFSPQDLQRLPTYLTIEKRWYCLSQQQDL